MPYIIPNTTAITQTVSAAQIVVNGTTCTWPTDKIVEGVKVIHHIECSIGCENTGTVSAELKFSLQRDIGSGWEDVTGEVACYTIASGDDARRKTNFKVPYYTGISGFIPRYRLLAECPSGEVTLHRAEGRDAVPTVTGKQEHEFEGDAPVLLPVVIQDIALAGASTYLIYSDGTIRDTGHNFNGQLGRGDNSNKYDFGQAGVFTDWETLFSGSDSVSLCGFGLRNGGQLWGTGENSLGQLGKGDNTDINTFTQIGTDTDWADVKAGGGHTVALKTNGTVWTTGQGTSGQLGLGDNADRNTFGQIAGEYKEIAAGGVYTLMIGVDGKLYGMGSNQYGQLGLPSGTTSVNTPTLLDSGEWLHVATSSNRGIAIKSDGTIWFAGQFYGSGTVSYAWVQRETDSNWTAVKGGGSFCIAIKSNGTAWAYGFNGTGQLGLGDTVQRNVFTQIGSDTDWESVLCGAMHCIAKKGGLIYRWGANNVGQLGTGSTTQKNSPLLLSL